MPLDHDTWLDSGPGGPMDSEAFCKRSEYAAVERIYEHLDSCAVQEDMKNMPRDVARKIADLRDELMAWLENAEADGIEEERQES